MSNSQTNNAIQPDLWSASYTAPAVVDEIAPIITTKELDANTAAKLQEALNNVNLSQLSEVPAQEPIEPIPVTSAPALQRSAVEEELSNALKGMEEARFARDAANINTIPDVIINPHRFPTRTTIGSLLELHDPQNDLFKINQQMTPDQMNEMRMQNDDLDSSSRVIATPQPAVFDRIRAREQRLFEDLQEANERLEELDIQQSYPLSPDLLFRDHQEIKDHYEPPTPELFRKLDTASAADRRAFAANLLNESQIHHILRCYELRYLRPADAEVVDANPITVTVTEPTVGTTQVLLTDSVGEQTPVAPAVNETEVLEKALEFISRVQWCGGGIYIDDSTWGVHPHLEDKPDGDYCLSNTMDQDYIDNPCLEKYLDDFCYLMERFFPTIDASYKSRQIKHSNRVLIIIHFNLKTIVAERKRLRAEMDEESDCSDDEEVAESSDSDSGSDSRSASEGSRGRRNSDSSNSGDARDL